MHKLAIAQLATKSLALDKTGSFFSSFTITVRYIPLSATYIQAVKSYLTSLKRVTV